MAKTYTKVSIIKDSDYPTSVSAWKNKYEKPANLVATSAEFELNTEDMRPGKYRINFWKSAEKKSEKYPDGNFTMDRVTDDETSAEGPAGVAPTASDFNF